MAVAAPTRASMAGGAADERRPTTPFAWWRFDRVREDTTPPRHNEESCRRLHSALAACHTFPTNRVGLRPSAQKGGARVGLELRRHDVVAALRLRATEVRLHLPVAASRGARGGDAHVPRALDALPLRAPSVGGLRLIPEPKRLSPDAWDADPQSRAFDFRVNFYLDYSSFRTYGPLYPVP